MASPLTNSNSKPTRSTSRKDQSATTHSTTSQKNDAKNDVREPCGTCDKPVIWWPISLNSSPQASPHHAHFTTIPRPLHTKVVRSGCGLVVEWLWCGHTTASFTRYSTRTRRTVNYLSNQKSKITTRISGFESISGTIISAM